MINLDVVQDKRNNILVCHQQSIPLICKWWSLGTVRVYSDWTRKRHFDGVSSDALVLEHLLVNRSIQTAACVGIRSINDALLKRDKEMNQSEVVAMLLMSTMITEWCPQWMVCLLCVRSVLTRSVWMHCWSQRNCSRKIWSDCLMPSAHGPILYRIQQIGVQIGSFALTFGPIKDRTFPAIKIGRCALTQSDKKSDLHSDFFSELLTTKNRSVCAGHKCLKCTIKFALNMYFHRHFLSNELIQK